MMTMHEEIIKALRATPAVVRALTSGLGDTALRTRPAPGEWAIIEVVAHLADVDERALARVMRILGEDNPELPAFDQEGLAVERRYLEADFGIELGRHAASRRELIAVLDGLAPAEWDRTAEHGEHGEMSLLLYAAHVAAEEIDHLAQIARMIPPLPTVSGDPPAG